jgi:hypothetical protein
VRATSAAVLVALVLTTSVACAQERREPTATSAPTTTTTTPRTTTPAPTPEPEPIYWPLTGVETAQAVQRPALAVKIENSSSARPQTGLSAADQVWEQVVEGGITRFVAVYHSHLPPEIGPVRSVRPMDPGIAGPLHGLLAFSGGQQPFVDAVRAAGLQVISQDAGAAGYYRTGRPAPHNIYADPSALVAQADAAHAASPAPQFVFVEPGERPSSMTAGAPATVVDLELSGIGRPRWDWDQLAGRWVRSERGVPAVEANGTPLQAVNVVVLRVDVVQTPYVDAIGTHVPETVMVGSGAAWVATSGHAVQATWSKTSATAPVVLTDANGRPITLYPGNTWIELVPNGTGAVTVG